MAIYFAFHCGHKGCGQRLVNDEKRKRYVHANLAPEKESHKPIVKSTATKETK